MGGRLSGTFFKRISTKQPGERINMFTSLRSPLGAFGRTLSLMNPDIQRHHERTAYVAYQIVRAMELGQDALFYATNAALTHEIGCAVLDNARETLTTKEGRKRIAKTGAYMLRDMEEFQTVAEIIEISQNSYTECLARGANGDLSPILFPPRCGRMFRR